MSGINSLSSSLFTAQSAGSGSNGITNVDLSATLSGSQGSSPVSATALYQQYEKNGTAIYQKFINSPKLKAEIEQFKASLSGIKTVDEVFQNPRYIDSSPPPWESPMPRPRPVWSSAP